MNVYQANDLNR